MNKADVLRVAGEPVGTVVMFNGFKDIRYDVKDVELNDKLYTEAQLLAMYAKGAEDARFPEFLFDSYAVYEALDDRVKARTGPENVCDVLDAVVRLIRTLPITPTNTEGEQA